VRLAYHRWQANRAALKMSGPESALQRKAWGHRHDYHATLWHYHQIRKEARDGCR